MQAAACAFIRLYGIDKACHLSITVCTYGSRINVFNVIMNIYIVYMHRTVNETHNYTLRNRSLALPARHWHWTGLERCPMFE